MNKLETDILNIIFKIKERPQVYLGNKSIIRLKCFLDGFKIAYDFPNVSVAFPEFYPYISKKYNCIKSYSWCTILYLEANNDEKAFDLFFDELENFLKENNIEIPEIK